MVESLVEIKDDSLEEILEEGRRKKGFFFLFFLFGGGEKQIHIHTYKGE